MVRIIASPCHAPSVRRLPSADVALIERVLVNVGVLNADDRSYVRPNFAELIVDIADGPDMNAKLQLMTDFVRAEATDGRHEWFKTTQYYDSKPHRDQHGFPPIRTAIEE